MATPSIQWTGVDSSSFQRKSGWYAIWVVIFLVLAAGAFALQWFFEYWQFWSVLALAVLIFITLIIANRSKQEINYSLTKKDISINKKTFPLSDFRAFSVSNSGGVWNIHLIPNKKVAMEFDIIVPSENAEKIVGVFSKLMPMEDSAHTIADKLASVLKL